MPDAAKSVLFDRLFPMGHEVSCHGLVLDGWAMTDAGRVHVLGTTMHAAIDGHMALTLSRSLLDKVAADRAQRNPAPILMVADTQGQALSRHEELLGLNGHFAHLARCVHWARRNGHRLLALVDGKAVSGGFLAFGLLADVIVALPGAEVQVMDLRAMSRVTRLSLEQLEALSQTSPVFAPGADNYWRMGGLHVVWQDNQDWATLLADLCRGASDGDDRRALLGELRGGRTHAAEVGRRILNDHAG